MAEPDKQLALSIGLTAKTNQLCLGLESGAADILERVTPTTAELLLWWFGEDMVLARSGLQGADRVFTLRHQVHGQEPGREREFCVLKHRAHDRGRLVAADQALPELTSAAVSCGKRARTIAARAVPALRPTRGKQGAFALLLATVLSLKVSH